MQPISTSRDAPNGKRPAERSSPVSVSSKPWLPGPINPRVAHPAVMSATTQSAPSGTWRRSQSRSRTALAAAVTTQYRRSARRVTVRSASMPPRSFSQWV